MRCRVEEQYREEVTYYNVTNSIFNNETNATDVLVTINKNTSMVLESITVRSVNLQTAHDSNENVSLMINYVCDCRQVTVSNDIIELTFENDTERTLLTSVRNLVTGLVTELSVDMVYYIGGRHAQQPPWVVRPSGQYVFHPAHPAEPVRLVLICWPLRCTMHSRQQQLLVCTKSSVCKRCVRIRRSCSPVRHKNWSNLRCWSARLSQTYGRILMTAHS